MRSDQLILRDMFRRALERFGDRAAITAPDGSLSYEELLAKATVLAGALQARGIEAGDRVVFLLRNSVHYVIADVAVMLVGACKVPLNDMLAADDVGYMIGHSDAKAVIAHTSFLSTLAAIESTVESVGVRLAVIDTDIPLPGFETVSFESDGGRYSADTRIDGDDPGLIIYTGGTTGRPKGVYHTQQSLAVNFMSHLINAEIAHDEHLLICSPLPHSAQQFVLAALLRGARVTIETGFDADRVLQLIAEERVTWMFMVPTMIYRLLDAPALAGTDTSSLRTIVYGASPITSARLQQALQRFGAVFLQIYGQTEIPNLVTTLSKADHEQAKYQTSCGQPVIFCDVVIRDEEGSAVEIGNAGEITVRSFYTLERYHADPERTDAAYVGEYLRTGDIGYQAPTGHIYLVDRAKDMIISGGMNVYSTEVENVIQEVDGVGQVVVIGVPDDDWGEAVTAFVIPNGTALDGQAVITHCKSQLAKYKVPKRVELVTEIPLTAYGKPDKKALRARFWSDEARQIN
ncbi:MAG: AMP-binding protein [Pseudomonadota bacterium]